MSLFALALLVAHPHAPRLHTCPVARAIDGDTIACGNLHLRLLGIDTPDKTSSAPCRSHIGNHVCDNDLAHAATVSMRTLLVQPVTYRRITTDRYGRTVAQVYVGGRDLQCLQLQAGVARYLVRYDNGGRIKRSCPGLAK